MKPIPLTADIFDNESDKAHNVSEEEKEDDDDNKTDTESDCDEEMKINFY